MTCSIVLALHLIARIVCGAIKTGAFLVLTPQPRKFGRTLTMHHVRIVDRARSTIHAKVGARIGLALFAPETDVTFALWTAQANGALTVAATESLANTIFTSMTLVVVGALAAGQSACASHANTLILATQFIAILAIDTVETLLANARFAAVLCHRAVCTIHTEVATLRCR